MTTHQNGQIILWDLKNVDPNSGLDSVLLRPERLTTLYGEEGVTRCLFLPHDNIVRASSAAAATSSSESTDARAWTACFCTATRNNATFTIWSPFSENATPTKLQEVAFWHPSPSYLLAVCFGPSPADAVPFSSFIVLADRSKGSLFAFHIKSKWNEQPGGSTQTLAAGCDYVVPFSTKYPIFPWEVLCSPTTDILEEELSEQGGLIFNMKLYCYQSQVVQALTLTSYMCLPPETSWTGAAPGVSAVVVVPASALDLEEMATETPIVYDEIYELDDDVEEVEDDFPEGPAASSLPPPIGFGARNNEEVDSSNGTTSATSASIDHNNAFANWLGAIAAKSSDFKGTANTGAMLTTGGVGVSPAPGLLSKRQPPDLGFSPRERLPPPPPPPTPANTAIKALSALSNIPTLPGIEDPAIVGMASSRQLSSPFLSPVDMLARSGGILDDKIPSTTGSAPGSPSDTKKKSKPGKREKNKPHKTPKAPAATSVPLADGKIFILKRGEENAIPNVVSSSVMSAAAPSAVASAPPAVPVEFEEILDRVLTSQAR